VLLTLTTTAVPATDLGYLLGKNPARLQTFELAFGKAYVFYPEASEDRCTATLLLEVDPVGLAQQAIPLSARLSVVPCRGGEEFLRQLFEPLGYEVTARRQPARSK
jgi:hypothetical protein